MTKKIPPKRDLFRWKLRGQRRITPQSGDHSLPQRRHSNILPHSGERLRKRQRWPVIRHVSLASRAFEFIEHVPRLRVFCRGVSGRSIRDLWAFVGKEFRFAHVFIPRFRVTLAKTEPRFSCDTHCLGYGETLLFNFSFFLRRGGDFIYLASANPPRVRENEKRYSYVFCCVAVVV